MADPGGAQQMMRTMTQFGPVSLGQIRKPLQMQCKEAMTIKPGWLKEVAVQDEQTYHHAIKQAMLVSARTLDVLDGLENWESKDEGIAGIDQSVLKEMKVKTKSLPKYKTELESLSKGRIHITTAGHRKSVLKKIMRQEERERSLMIKYGKKSFCCERRERGFLIVNGELVIYKSKAKHAKESLPRYPMSEARIFVEERTEGLRQFPLFEQGYNQRINCKFDSRGDMGKSPLYLYPKDEVQCLYWQKAFKLARSLKTDNDRRSLKTCVGRATNMLFMKGWETMFWYFSELKVTRDLVHKMGMRLMQAELSRGWHKIKLVWEQELHKEFRREEQQKWAARYLSEKLARIGTQGVKTPQDVREQVITRIQDRFRNYRDDAIFDRKYPISAGTVLRTRQSRQGFVGDCSFDALDCDAVLKIIFQNNATVSKIFEESPEMLKTSVSTYSYGVINPSPRLFSVSDNLQTMTFHNTAGGSKDAIGSLMTKANLSNFVNLDRISQVVVHSTAQPGLEPRTPEQIRDSKCENEEGVWCTIYGPKVSWGKRVDVVQSKDGKSSNAVGSGDGFAVPHSLGDKYKNVQKYVGPGKAIEFANLRVKITDCNLDLVPIENKKNPKLELPSDENLVSTEAHVHVLGYRFSDKDFIEKGGGKLQYKAKKKNWECNAKVPIPKDCTVMLDESPLAVSIVQTYKVKDTEKEYKKEVMVGSVTLGEVFELYTADGKDGKGGSKVERYKDKEKIYSILLRKPDDDAFYSETNVAKVTISASFEKDSGARDDKPVSPEFIGAGMYTALYTSHRGAWYDSSVESSGKTQFRLDHVANFVEVILGDLYLEDATDDAPDAPFLTYRVRASINGMTAMSVPLHKNRRSWATILGARYADTKTIDFGNARLCLPLPPGCWASTEKGKRPTMDIEIVEGKHINTNTKDDKKTDSTKSKPINWRQFIEPMGERVLQSPPEEEKVIAHTTLVFDMLVVDEQKHVSGFLASGPLEKGEEIVVDVGTNMVDEDLSKTQSKGSVLNMDCCLRDRDYVRTTAGKPSEQRTLCVGDKCLMNTEEPMIYPKCLTDFKTRFTQGEFEEVLLEEEYSKEMHTSTSLTARLEEAFKKWKKDHPEEKGMTKQEWDGRLVFYSDAWKASDEDLLKEEYAKEISASATPSTLLSKLEEAFRKWRKDHPGEQGIKKPEWEKRLAALGSNPVAFREGMDAFISSGGTNIPQGWLPRSGGSSLKKPISVKLRGGPAGEWTMDLRDPCLSSEYSESGLGDMIPRQPYRPGVIPNYCNEVVPHKYVLPNTECEFRKKNLPGVWPYILEDLVKTNTATTTTRGGLQKTMVTRLKSMERNIPVTLLAMYPDGTCDLEVTSQWLKRWQKQPLLEYCLPGVLMLQPSPEKDGTPRAFLKKVPSTVLTAVHTSGFHLYDANYKTLDDVKNANIPMSSFDPCSMPTGQSPREKGTKDPDEALIVKAGPLPCDSSPASCQFEWALSVRSKSETEMYRFVAMLRQSVRLSQYVQGNKADEYKNTFAGQTGKADMDAQTRRQKAGGQLEIILVEARRLEPAVGVAFHKLKDGLADMKEMYDNQRTRLGSVTNPLGSLANPLEERDVSNGTPDGADINTFVKLSLRSGGEIMALKNAKDHKSPPINHTSSPSWAAQQNSDGGHHFPSILAGAIDPQKFKDLVIELEVCQTYGPGGSYGPQVGVKTIGKIQIGVNSRPVLTDPQAPFRNMWLPLYGSTGDGKTFQHKKGELHILTRWTPADKMEQWPQVPLPSIRAAQMKELWPQINLQRIKEPVYQIEPRYMPYNPNLVRGELKWCKDDAVKPQAGYYTTPKWAPETPPEFFARQVEALWSEMKYMECLDRKQTTFWEAFEKRLGDMGHGIVHLGDLREEWVRGDAATLSQFNELLEGGIPVLQREKRWLELTGACYLMYGVTSPDSPPEALLKAAEAGYVKYLTLGSPQASDANLQLQEDCFHLSCWESTVPSVPELLDFHLRRIRRAQNVCTALIAYQECGTAYCESLLVLAFFLLLPQGVAEPKGEDTNAALMSEASAFWILHSLITGPYKEYYGRQRAQARPMDAEMAQMSVPAGESLCVSSGAMDDVALLEGCLAYYEPALWSCFNALGFQLSTVFYGAFMRLFATYMPTASVFRFWDILLPMVGMEKVNPNHRVYLVDLAFGVLKTHKDDLMACVSAREIRTSILYAFGSMYDVSSAVDVTMHYHKFLWEIGGGWSVSRIAQLCNQRQEVFRLVNQTTYEQNDLLKEITHVTALGTIKRTSYKSASGLTGVQTSEMARQVMPVVKTAVETIKATEASQTAPEEEPVWAMHRPMPLVAELMSQNWNEKTWDMVKGMLNWGDVDDIPSLKGPPPSVDPKRIANVYAEALEVPGVTQENLMRALSMDVPNWVPYSGRIWEAFTNRRDVVLKRRLKGQEEDGFGLFNLFGLLPANQQEARLGKMMKKNMNVAESISMNEVYTSLICCSRGTVGHKASALFDVYGHTQQGLKELKHILPTTNFAKSVVRVDATKSKVVLAPEPSDEKNHALCFTVWSNYPKKHTIVGKVFIPKLCEFESSGTSDTGEINTYNIWGPPPAKVQGIAGSNNSDPTSDPNDPNSDKADGDGANKVAGTAGPASDTNSVQSVTSQQTQTSIWGRLFGKTNLNGQGADETAVKDKVCLGDMKIGIVWLPKGTSGSATGQLCIHVKSISFYQMYVSEPRKKNPYVTLHTYDPKAVVKEEDCSGKPLRDRNGMPPNPDGATPISRWDPRRVFSTDQHHSWLATHGAYGNNMIWEQSMKEGMIIKENLSSYRRDGDQGWKPSTKPSEPGEWTWNETWGKQFSDKEFTFQPDFVKKEAKKNVMDMLGVRRIIQSILTRSCLNLSNRQMVLIADTLFNRGGVVPGILEAWIVSGSDKTPVPHKGRIVDTSPDVQPKAMNLQELRKEWTSKSLNMVDVTSPVALEHEKQIRFSGHLNLFKKDYLDAFKLQNGRELHLKDIGDDKGFLEKMGFSAAGPKTLWIRYVRAGDGERCTQGACFAGSGELKRDKQDPDPEIYMDLPVGSETEGSVGMQNMVSREEFISCMIDSPLIGETLRRMGSVDHVMAPRQPIALDVTIMDPHRTEDDDMFADAVNVQQSILLEVWDSDTALSQDFLGEAWLPPLETLTSFARDFVLPLRAPDYSGDDERGASRETRKKNIVGATAKDAKITGNLFVRLQWVYPLYTLSEDGELVKRIDEDEEGGDDEPTDATSAEARADIQEGLHTGQLRVTVLRAAGLRRADSLRGKDCDAYVQGWIRNDAREDEENPGQKAPTWKDKHIFKTSTIKNSKNPEWKGKDGKKGESFKLEILSGAFEARFEEEGEGIIDTIKDAMRTDRAKRWEKEEEEMQALDKFGGQGLKLKFGVGEPVTAIVATGPQDEKAKAAAAAEQAKKEAEKAKNDEEPPAGTNHGVEVFRGDSIREFKAKVTLACEREAKFWAKKGITYDDKTRKYTNVKITYKHLVMIFVPSAKVKQLYAQKLQTGAEYKHAYNMALMDPSSWQPLEPTRTFHQYTQYHFDLQGGTPQQVRIVEATESYRNVNLRYKEFDQEQNKRRFEDQDTEEMCYGWARYHHRGDDKPQGREDQTLPWEWRPATISPAKDAEGKALKPPQYSVEWSFKCFGRERTEGEKHRANQVMLAPRVPQMAEAFDPLHEEVLEQAKTLRMMGKSDWEIEAQLNKQLTDGWNRQKASKDEDKGAPLKPTPLSVDIIRAYLHRSEMQAAARLSQAAGLKAVQNTAESKASSD